MDGRRPAFARVHRTRPTGRLARRLSLWPARQRCSRVSGESIDDESACGAIRRTARSRRATASETTVAGSCDAREDGGGTNDSKNREQSDTWPFRGCTATARSAAAAVTPRHASNTRRTGHRHWLQAFGSVDHLSEGSSTCVDGNGPHISLQSS